MPAIVPVATARQLDQFVELPYVLHAADPHWVPPLRRDERRRLAKRHNAFLEHAEMALWLATEGGRVTGRIAAIDDRLYDEKHGREVSWFGFLECADAATARALLAAVEERARRVGRSRVVGPANPSLNESAGLLVEGFDDPPCILMPYNPPAYAAALEAAGFTKVKDLLAWDLDLTAGVSARIARAARRAAARHGVVVRTCDLRAFDRELRLLHEIYRAAWQDNWGFVAPTGREVAQMAAELRPIVDPELVLFAELHGRPVGCAVAIPDINQVLKRMNGRLWPFGIVHFLRRRRYIDRARTVLLGVRPEARRLGLYPLLIAELHRRGLARGYRRSELSWTLEDNDAVNAGIEAAGGRRYKTYRLYEKRLPN
jgi:hypothetical protein